MITFLSDNLSLILKEPIEVNIKLKSVLKSEDALHRHRGFKIHFSRNFDSVFLVKKKVILSIFKVKLTLT